MWIFAPSVSLLWAQFCRCRHKSLRWSLPIASPCHGSYSGMWPAFVTFHILMGYGGILVASQNCTKSCFIFMTLFLPSSTLSSQFYIKEQKLTLIYMQFMIQGLGAEQTLALDNAQIFSNGAHLCHGQLLQGCSEFHRIFSQDVALTESKNRGFPSGYKISVWVIQEIWLEGFSSHSAVKLCGYMQERAEDWKSENTCCLHFSFPKLPFILYINIVPNHSLEGGFAGGAFTLWFIAWICALLKTLMDG